MSKELFIAAHEEEIEEYLAAHPNATWEQAYYHTADAAYIRMTDKLADVGDAMRQRAKEGGQ